MGSKRTRPDANFQAGPAPWLPGLGELQPPGLCASYASNMYAGGSLYRIPLASGGGGGGGK